MCRRFSLWPRPHKFYNPTLCPKYVSITDLITKTHLCFSSIFFKIDFVVHIFSVPALKCRCAIAIPLESASTCKMLGQILKSWNLSLSVFFFLHFNFAYITIKAPYNKNLRQARIR